MQGVQKKVDSNFLSMNWRKMLWVLKYILVNNKIYIILKCCVLYHEEREHSEHSWALFYIKVIYYSVCALEHLIMCTCPLDRKARFDWLVCLLDFKFGSRLLSWNFVQVLRKYIPTPSENITNIQLTMPFTGLLATVNFFSGHLVYTKSCVFFWI